MTKRTIRYAHTFIGMCATLRIPAPASDAVQFEYYYFTLTLYQQYWPVACFVLSIVTASESTE